MSDSIKKKPVVSIGLPVYNGAERLADTIELLLNQTFTDFEILISDDASSDETEKICKDFEKKDSRITYFRQAKNLGNVVKNFQFVLSKAEGEYFMFACHDDLWEYDYVEKLVKILDDDKDCSLAFSDWNIANLLGDEKILITVSSSTSPSPYIRYLSRLIDLQPHLIFGLFRRNLVSSKDFALFDYFEVNFGLNMALRGKVRIANECLMSWGVEGERKSYSVSGKYMNYFPFYFSQLKLIWKNFPIFKAMVPLLILTIVMTNRVVKRFIRPKNTTLSFRNN
jgi:glycosyltransferase involved in cell wall biosynthesis